MFVTTRQIARFLIWFLFVHQTLILSLEVNAMEVQFSKFSIESKGYEEGCLSWHSGCQDEIDYSNFKKVLHSKVTRSSGLQQETSSRLWARDAVQCPDQKVWTHFSFKSRENQSARTIRHGIFYLPFTQIFWGKKASQHTKKWIMICLKSTSKLNWFIPCLTLLIPKLSSAISNLCWCLRQI